MTDFINSLTNEQCLTFGFICGMLLDIIGPFIAACTLRKKYIKEDNRDNE